MWVKIVAAQKTFCGIFSPGEPMYLKITLVIAQTYSYVCTNVGPFIWMFVIIFTGVTPQILRFQFSLLQNSWIFRKKQVTSNNI